MERIKTPSGLDAEVLLPDAWGSDRVSAGLRYVGSKARRRLGEVFTNALPLFDLEDIVADMNAYKFGYVDDLVLHRTTQLAPCFGHILPIAYITDNLPNCMWHADKVLVHFGGEADRIFDPSAVTFLYPEMLDASGPKETGFAHPSCVADAYASSPLGGTVEPTAEGLRRFADETAKPLHVDSGAEFPAALERVSALLRHSYWAMDAVLSGSGTHAMHWLEHKQRRLMLFSNTIVHANDLFRRESVASRQQQIFRRMLPGGRMLGFNSGVFAG